MKIFEAVQALGQKLTARGVKATQIAALLALVDQRWLDELVALVERYAPMDGMANDEVSKPKDVVAENASHAAARAIMGTNFLGIKEVQTAFGVKYSLGDRTKLVVIPFDAATLHACADSHILVAGFPMSINDIRRNSRVKVNATKLFYSAAGTGSYNAELFANNSMEVRWYLLRKRPIQNSVSRWYNDQLKLVSPGEENPWVRDVVFALTALFLTTGERLFEKTCVRCRDVSSRGARVILGYFDRGGLCINVCSNDWNGYPDGSAAICSIRSPPYSNRTN